jgi:hypothetical protein
VDSSPPYRAEPSFRAAGAAASPHGCRVSAAPDPQTDHGGADVSPFWHAGTERPLHRPADPEDQQEYYRGKKKCHTVKNLLGIDATCQSCFWSATDAGKANDKILAELEGYHLPSGSYLYQEMGFQGFVWAGVTIIQPKRKPRGGELTPPEKALNRRLASIRIRIEHAIGGVKRDRIVKDNIRLLKDGMRDTLRETCCGLHNYRLQYRPWHYAS